MLASRERTSAAWRILCAAAICCTLPHVLGVTYTPVSFNVCGNQFTDGNGATWYGKSFISASSAGAGCANTTGAITVGAACSPTSGSTICGQTQLQQMLQYQAIGANLTYTNIGIGSVGKKNTTYAITLYFADYNATASGQRVFNIQINGQMIATAVDIYALGGGDYSAVSVAAPAFYSGSRSNFDVALPTVAGTASILTGVSFQLATSTNVTLTPSVATWGDSVLLQIFANSLNPVLGNLTGNYSAYITGGNIPSNTIVNVTGGAGGSLAQAYGSYALNTSLLTTCNGGAANVTVSFNDPKELYGNSVGTASIVLAPACSATTTAPVTTSAPPTTTGVPPTTAAPDTTTSAPDTTTNAPGTSTLAPPSTTEMPPTTTVPDATTSTPDPTTAPPGTSTFPPPTTTEMPPTTTVPDATTSAPDPTTAPPGTSTFPTPTTTEMPPTTTGAETTTSAPDTTTAAPGTSTLVPPTTTVPLTSDTPVPSTSVVPKTTLAPDTTTVPETSSAAPGTTAAPMPTTITSPPTSAAPQPSSAPATTATPGTTASPGTTISPYNVSMQMAFYPDPPIAGGQLTISGEATSDDGIPPTGNVNVVVDGAVIGTTPLVPVNGTSSTPLAHIVETGSSGARTVPPQPNRIMRRALSLTAVGRSVFSYTFLAPSTPGAHTIMAVVTSGGTTTPIAAPVMVNITVVPAANMTLTLDGGHAVGVIGPAHRCKASLTAVANVTGPADATSFPTGNVTLAITNPATSLIPVHLVTNKVVRLDGIATFVIDPNPAAAALEVVKGLFTRGQTTIGELPLGAYNMTATYNGDGIYPPAIAFAKLLISPTCLLTTLVLS